MTLAYHEAARGELLEEVVWLEDRAPGLGRRFLAEVIRVESSILEFPQAGEEIRPGIRRRLLRKFQYSLFYSMEVEGPVVLAVAHHRRRPGYWLHRSS